MTITYVAAGAAVYGNNSSITPAAITGVAAGDLVVIMASIRATAGRVTVPAGWVLMTAAASNVVLLGRFWKPGDVLPLVAFTLGAAGDDTIVQAAAWRGVAPDQTVPVAVSALTNVSAANVAYPALDVPGANHLVLLAEWKQDDATAVSNPASYSLIALASTTTGNDASSAWWYRIETTEVDLTAGSITVTGGAAAVSAAVVLAIKPAAAVSTLLLDLYPPRVLVTVTGLTLGDDVEIYRSVGGVRTLVRDGSSDSVTDPAFLKVDAELPFGVPVTYYVIVNDTAEYATTPATYTLPGGQVVLYDAITGISADTVILAWDEKGYDTKATVFHVGGRNVVVSTDPGQFVATIELYFEAYSAGQKLAALLASATEGIILLRSPSPTYLGVDAYLAVLSYRERRFSQDGSDERRVYALDVAQTDPWGTSQEASGFTWQNVADYYATGTWATLAVDYATWLAVAQGDFT